MSPVPCYDLPVQTESPTISFLTAQPADVPAPSPAAQHIPDWLKQMPANVTLTTGAPGPAGSVKKCMPFVDAMTCGYLIPIAGDVKFYMTDATNLDIISPEELVTWQSHEQVPGAPFEQRMIVKFRNPWVVQTPPGYSTLFTPMLNQLNLPFQILAGLVETDRFYNEVYFPAINMMRPGQMFELKKGTPIVQAIPIKREPWTSTVTQVDAAKLKQAKADLHANEHLYRETNWEKKTYR